MFYLQVLCMYIIESQSEIIQYGRDKFCLLFRYSVNCIFIESVPRFAIEYFNYINIYTRTIIEDK